LKLTLEEKIFNMPESSRELSFTRSRHYDFNANKEMINVVDRYFSLNRTLLLVIGLWPYEKSKFTELQIICIFSILTTCIIFQV